MEETKQVTFEEVDGLVSQMADLRKEKDAKEDELSAINGKLTELKEKAVAYLTELKRDSYKSPFGTLSLREVWSVAVPKTDESKERLFEFLKSEGIFNAYATVNSNSLKALYLRYREAAQENGELDFQLPGVEPAKLFMDISFRKA